MLTQYAIAEASTESDLSDVRRLFEAYAKSLPIDLRLALGGR